MKYLLWFFLLLSITFLSGEEKSKSHYYDQFTILRESENWQEGERVYTEAINQYPQELNFHCYLNEVLRKLKKLDEALSRIEPIFENNQNHEYVRISYLWTFIDYGLYHREMGNLTEGLELLEIAYALDNENLTASLWYGILLSETGHYREAITVFDKTQILYPENEYLPGNINHAYFQLARGLDENNQTEEAIAIYEEVSNRFPQHLYYYYYLFTNYMKLNDYDRAEETLYRWVKAKFEYPPEDEKMFDEENNISYRMSDLRKIFTIENQFERAFKLYEDLGNYFRHTHLVVNGLGELHWHQGNIEKGIELINSAYDCYIADNPQYRMALTMDFPLRGLFVVAEGNNSPETLTHAGPGRYCYDFMGSDRNGRTTKPGTIGRGRNEDYYGFGRIIYSPVEGVVHSLENDAPDHAPTDQWMYELPGNHITIRTAENYNVVFVHNQQHSALVTVGDRVTIGQPIARLGNTSSSVPHLHFGVWAHDWTVSIPVRFHSYWEVNGESEVLRENEFPEKGTVILY